MPDAESYGDEDGRSDLIAADRDDDSPLHTVIANQVLADEPAAVWRTATRLLTAGFSRHATMDQLVTALRPSINAALTDGARFDPDDYEAALDRLPLPTVDDVVALYLAAAREARVVAVDELEHQVAHQLGLSADDPLTASLLDDVDRELHDSPHSPVVMLASDLVAYVPVLVDGGVFTHRLTADEQAEDRLDLRPDLAALTWLDEPRVGEVVLDADLEHWHGPRDWLADLPVDVLLAVRATEDGAVTVEALRRHPLPLRSWSGPCAPATTRKSQSHSCPSTAST